MLEPVRPQKDMLTAMLRQAMRSLAKVDPAVYIEYVTGRQPAAHHRQILDFAHGIVTTKGRGVILCPRGAGKTTIITEGLLSWLIATNPAIRIGLFSQKAEKAEAMSAAIMGMIDASDEFREVFGDLHGNHKWTASEWLRKGSPHYRTKDRTMVASGAMQSSSAVSKRFDLIICDDVLDENNTATIDQREKFETWFWKSLLPTQAAEGAAVLVIGTRWVEDDLYQRLMEKNHWPSLVIPAISVDPDTGDEVSYWPEVWPLDRLYAEREDVGWDNFACSYLNDISGLREGTIFQRKWWADHYFEELPRDRGYVFTIGIDLATSMKERADWTAGVVTARCDRGEHWVLRHERIKTDSGHRAFVKSLWDWCRSQGYPVSRIVMENNQAQESIVAGLQRDEPDLPIIGRRTDTDKASRARGAATRYESHRVHHHESLRGRELETEMLGFPKGHDDLVDALGLSMDLDAGSGTVMGAKTPQRGSDEPTGPFAQVGSELPFRDGARLVPAYLVTLMRGIDTATMTYDEAIAASNQQALGNYLRNALGGVLRR